MSPHVWISVIVPYLNLSKASLYMVCSTAHSDSSAQRRKWRVLVPILHFWNSLGKEAPLHLLLFVVADIISFPDQSVRVSCHSVKILLCYGEGFVGGREGEREGKGARKSEAGKGGGGVCHSRELVCKERAGVGEGSWASVHKKFFSTWVSKPLCLHLSAEPNSKWTEACHNEVPLFSKQPDFIFLKFRLTKRKKKCRRL